MILPNDVRAGYLSEKAAIDSAIQRVLMSGSYILGEEVRNFEQEFSAYIHVQHAVGTASGTDALMLALRALGIGQGDCVLTVSHTAVATVAAIEMAGATPLLVDIDPQSYTMCPDSLQRAIRHCGKAQGKPRAIIPVHLYGQSCDMTSLLEIANQHSLRVIEDCSQSHGATWNAHVTGSLGDIGAFSLYPTKNLGALGDAGIITTKHGDIAETLRMLRQYGWKERNRSLMSGFNSRLDELQAAILRERLKTLDHRTSLRQRIAIRYTEHLKEACVTPQVNENATHVYHQYVVQTDMRDEVRLRLREAGIETMIHYPIPIHLQEAYAGRLPKVVDLPGTEFVSGRILSLPMYPELTDNDVDRVMNSVLKVVTSTQKRYSPSN